MSLLSAAILRSILLCLGKRFIYMTKINKRNFFNWYFSRRKLGSNTGATKLLLVKTKNESEKQSKSKRNKAKTFFHIRFYTLVL